MIKKIIFALALLGGIMSPYVLAEGNKTQANAPKKDESKQTEEEKLGLPVAKYSGKFADDFIVAEDLINEKTIKNYMIAHVDDIFRVAFSDEVAATPHKDEIVGCALRLARLHLLNDIYKSLIVQADNNKAAKAEAKYVECLNRLIAENERNIEVYDEMVRSIIDTMFDGKKEEPVFNDKLIDAALAGK